MPYGIHALSAWGDQRRIAYVRVLGHGASGAPLCVNGMSSMISCYGHRRTAMRGWISPTLPIGCRHEHRDWTLE